MATVTKNSQILNGNAAISDGFRVAHSYLAKSDLDKLIIDGDKDMLLLLSLQPEQNERLKNIMIARMNETIAKIDLTHFVENQVLQLLFYG
jgi:DNA-binding TFAR19-related protein (PDSD5 family)